MEDTLDSFWFSLTQKYSPSSIYIIGTLLLHHFIFWTLCLPLLFLDLSHSPSFLYSFKIQHKIQITIEEVKKCVKNVLINQWLVMLPFNVVLYYLVVDKGGLLITAPLPQWFIYLYE